VEVVILAAGKGTRMNSSQPKVLHSIGGKAMLSHVLDTAQRLDPAAIHVVVGYGADTIKAHYNGRDINWVLQEQQLGTGHAVQQSIPHIEQQHSDNTVLVLFGDVPLISQATLEKLLGEAGSDKVALLSVISTAPDGFGRIVRDDSAAVQCIVEHKDASAGQRLINEVNTGIMALPAARLGDWLQRIDNSNKQQEYYLTDIIALAVADGLEVKAIQADNELEVMGVNDKAQLALLERHYQMLQTDQLLEAGVTLRDPARVDIRGELICGQDVEIDINVIFEGRVELADGVCIGANCVISNASIGSNTAILPGCNIEETVIGSNASIGPVARLRPGTRLADGVKIGNFVETKKAVIGPGSKANHLAYIGDAEIGSACNIGAGTIFCNYDGANKHKTVLGDNVFVGSNSVLIAPVNLADNSFVAAGSAINTDVAGDSLAVARAKQRNIPGWKRPVKSQS
jgi:bifunctional UDP-N-acetylglucosamine pyrophosphorylase/glucosamine-1-phosphate N-acetyltransferase